MSYDEKSYELAEHFLSDYVVVPVEDYRTVAARLAQRIQTGIEDDLNDLESEGKIRETRAYAPSLASPGIERKEQK